MSWVNVMPLTELPEGERHVLTVGDRSIALIGHQGQVFAISPRCPHMGGPVYSGRITSALTIICPWHHSAFDLRTGEIRAWAPWPPGVGLVLGAVRPRHRLPVYATRIQDGVIGVELPDAT